MDNLLDAFSDIPSDIPSDSQSEEKQGNLNILFLPIWVKSFCIGRSLLIF